MFRIVLSTILLFISFSSNANKLNNSIFYGFGERQSEVDWNIAGNLLGTNPNVISELEWKKIKSHQFLLGSVLQDGDYFLKFFGEYGYVYDGRNQDSDYNYDTDRASSRAQLITLGRAIY